MNVIDRPTLVVGVDHSGTSILYRMLARHPDLGWFSQYSLRDGSFPGRIGAPVVSGWVNRVGRRLVDFTWRKKERWLRPEPREGIGIWRRLIPRNDELLYASDCADELAERVRDVVASDLRAWRLERMLFKAPYLTRAVLLLDRIFPDALFLHIVRDGKAVALSNRQRIAEEKGLTRREALCRSAEYWVETLDYLEECARQLGPRLRTIRYEEFCLDVRGSLEAAFGYFGLDPDAAPLEQVPRTLVPTNDGWLRRCSARDRELLDDILGVSLLRWGYEPFNYAAVRAG